jgi:hypothetical protein
MFIENWGEGFLRFKYSFALPVIRFYSEEIALKFLFVFFGLRFSNKRKAAAVFETQFLGQTDNPCEM